VGKYIEKFMDKLGLSDYEDEEVEVTEKKKVSNDYSNVKTIDYGFPNSNNISRNNKKNASKVVNIHTNVQMEVVVSSPETFEEAKEICQNIKDKKPVVINLEKVDHSIAQRITDFACGACFALNGNIQRVTNQIYIIAPDSVDFAGDINMKDELKTNGIIFPISKEK